MESGTCWIVAFLELCQSTLRMSKGINQRSVEYRQSEDTYSIGEEAMPRQCEQPLIVQLGHCRSQCKTLAGSCRAVSHHVPSADMAGTFKQPGRVQERQSNGTRLFRLEGPDSRRGCLARLHAALGLKAPTEQQKHEIISERNKAKDVHCMRPGKSTT